jgi:hypothetical protein
MAAHTLAAALAAVSIGGASPDPAPVCAERPDGRCIPALTDVQTPDWIRAVVGGREAVVHMPARVTDMHAYGPRGRALVQTFSRRANAYVFTTPRRGRLVAAYDRTNGDWYVYRTAILAGWEA